MKQFVIFGSGYYGKLALKEIGAESIVCFIDNDKQKQGSEIDGIPIIGLEEYISTNIHYPVLVASTYIREMVEQLEKKGITDYDIYLPKRKEYKGTEVLIDNPYTTYHREASNEEEYNRITRQNRNIDYINQCVAMLNRRLPLFNHVEIETYNRCNGGCEFCPVSVKNELRPEIKMDEILFRKIIDDLARIEYDGKLALFSNNEPFLDERIIEFHKYARECLPKTRMHLYTNGTLLTMDKFLQVIEYLDELIIDNYNQNLELIPTNKAIKEYCEKNRELIQKVTIVLRKPKEILTSRGGDAPNRKKKISYSNDRCMLPFRQIIIRPDGKVSLCCNDPLGKVTMGDLNSENIVDIWYGDKFQEAREKIMSGRGNYPHCKFCDTFIIG